MKYELKEISGNSFSISLQPETPQDASLIKSNEPEIISGFYGHAIKLKLGEHCKVASLTPNDDFPISATVEVFTESGSV